MNALDKIKALKKRRSHRTHVKVRVHNRNNRKRIYIWVTNRYLTAQLIDDKAGKTLVTLTTGGKSNQGKSAKSIEASKNLAKGFYEKLKEINVTDEPFVFDRGDRIYHGKIKAFAEQLREQGLKI